MSDYSSIIVQSLVGKKKLLFYLKCLKSLTSFCSDKIDLLLHTDGTMRSKDMETVFSHFGSDSVRFYDSEEAKQATLDHLEGRPNCQKLRRTSLWGIEFFDPLFAAPKRTISHYIDADILFLRPFTGLFNNSTVEGGAVFLSDIQWDAYCLRPWHLFGFGMRPVIVKGITTALVCWDKRAIDWDYLEWFLSQNKFHRIPEWVMPTAQAGLASLCRSKVVSPNQLPNLYPNASIDQETFGVHLLGSYREEWLPKVEQYIQEMEPSHELSQVRFLPCQPRGASGYAFNNGKRWINTRLNRW
jgi:hypothetical protein